MVDQAQVEAAVESVESEAVQLALSTLSRRGYLQTENIVLVLSSLASFVLVKVGVPGPEAAQVVAEAAPIVAATVLATLRSWQKRALADLVARLHLPVSS